MRPIAFSTDAALRPVRPWQWLRGATRPTSRYAPDFVDRYRAAQRKRVERIDAYAQALLAEQAEARRALKAGGSSAAVRRRAAYAPIFQIWRTDADLRCWDLSLDAFGPRGRDAMGPRPVCVQPGQRGLRPHRHSRVLAVHLVRHPFERQLRGLRRRGDAALAARSSTPATRPRFRPTCRPSMAVSAPPQAARTRARQPPWAGAGRQAKSRGQLVAGRLVQDWLRSAPSR